MLLYVIGGGDGCGSVSIGVAGVVGVAGSDGGGGVGEALQLLQQGRVFLRDVWVGLVVVIFAEGVRPCVPEVFADVLGRRKKLYENVLTFFEAQVIF